MSDNINKPVKIVVWDMDETFWEGTISESEILYQKINHDIVIELSKRGIINSICSKNDLDVVQSELEKQNIWEYFVFPCISWESKGPRLNNLIKQLQIKAENVLFIDDNIHNLEEARYYCKDIQTAEPDILNTLLDHEHLKGKQDNELSRLKHYKILQQRTKDQDESKTDNIDFLKKSNIRVEVEKEVLSEIDRIHEMLLRTNQLNFTKNRSTKDELQATLLNNEIESGCIKVTDNYGDYGIVGFYALYNNKLIHFVFSCRILNMGVEQHLYNMLGKPQLEITGDVSSTLDTPQNIDWINQSKPLDDHRNTQATDSTSTNEILIKGSCDYEAMVPFITPIERVSLEFNYNGNAPLPIRNEHTEVLKRCTPEFSEKYKDVLKRIPFVDENTYKSKVREKNFDILIYNITMDYTYGLYQYKDTDFIIPYEDLAFDLTNKDDWPKLGNYKLFTNDFLEWFSKKFKYLGAITEDQFSENIRWLCNELLKDKQVIFVNGAEVNLSHHIEHDRWKHHQIMNKVLEETVKDLNNASICDIRDVIDSTKDITINIKRFNRHGYFKIAKKLQESISKISDSEIIDVNYTTYIINRILPKVYRFPFKIIKYIYKIFFRILSTHK